MNIALVLISVTFTTLGQVFQKLGAMRVLSARALGVPIWRATLNVYILLGIASLGLGAALWLAVLSRLDLSLAYPLLSLGYVLVTLCSKYLFHERLPRSRWVGIGCIMLGVALLSGS